MKYVHTTSSSLLNSAELQPAKFAFFHVPSFEHFRDAFPSDKIRSKGSLSQLMDDLVLINSVEQVEAMVNSIQKGVENVLRK